VRSWFFHRVRPEQVRVIVLFVVIIVLIAFFATQIPNYVSGRTFSRISTTLPIVLVVAVGQTLVVLTRNIDLSVGSIVGLVAFVVGTLLSRDNSIHPLIALAIAVGIGVVLGAVNGLLVAYGRVPAIVATLGTLAIYRMMVWESGNFELQPPDDKEFLEELDEPTEGLLMEAMRQLDEIRRLEGVPPRSAKLSIANPIGTAGAPAIATAESTTGRSHVRRRAEAARSMATPPAANSGA